MQKKKREQFYEHSDSKMGERVKNSGCLGG